MWYKEASKEQDPNSGEDVERNADEEKSINTGSSEECEYFIKDLVNGKRYLITVSAKDKAGNESSRSESHIGIPKPGRGLMELLGEDGECFIRAVCPSRVIWNTSSVKSEM